VDETETALKPEPRLKGGEWLHLSRVNAVALALCRFVAPVIRFIPDLLVYPVPL
jgi:hypothetical protein